MIPHRVSCFPHGSLNGAAPSARTDSTKANGAANVDVQLVVERVNAYGFHAEPVTHNGVWWVPFSHTGSLSPLATGVRVEWQL